MAGTVHPLGSQVLMEEGEKDLLGEQNWKALQHETTAMPEVEQSLQ